MSILSFTKKLSEKIKFYDEISQDKFSGLNMMNPFANDYTKPINLTIIWVDENCEEDS